MRCTSIRTLRALLAFAFVSHASAQSPALVDATSLGAAAAGGARDASLSADGRWVAFVSGSADLVAADSNAAADVFLCSRDAGAMVRASVANGGSESHPLAQAGFAGVACPAVSRDGRFVAFASNAADLVAGDTNNRCDVFVRDVVAGTTERVSVATDGTQGSADSGAFSWTSGTPAVESTIASGVGITPDGRFVVFASSAPELAAGATGVQQVCVHDRVTGITEIASVGPGGALADGACWFPSISDDGRFVAFDSASANLVANDTNGASDVFVHDRLLDHTVRVSVAADGSEANGPSGFAFEPFDPGCSCPISLPLRSRISGEGRVVVFASAATNLTSAPASSSDVYARDRVAGTTSLVSTNASGTGGDGASLAPVVSHDGRFVAFVSAAQDIVTLGNQSGVHVLVHDRFLRTTRLASSDVNGAAVVEHADQPMISADGAQVAFTTDAALSVGDQNGVGDVYASGIPSLAYTEACAGSASTCPCANAGAPDSGCGSSFEPDGARLEASGLPRVSQDGIVLVAHRLVPTTGVLFVQSGTSFSTATAPAFGDGVRCVGGDILRLATRIAAGDSAMLGVAQDARVSVLGQVTAAGGTRYYQACYRNTVPFCTSSKLNSTNSIRIDWQP